MAERTFISQFSPQRTDPAALEQILVQRHKLLAEAVAKVCESVVTGNKHHLLFIGSRGAGKTHLITLLHHRLSQQADLKDRMRFAWLNEDETSTSFLKLLVRIYRDLIQRYPSEFPGEDLQAVYGKEPDTARELLGRSLLSRLDGRTLVLLIENMDATFAAMSDVEQRTWRAFIQNHPVFATVATAQSLFSGVSDRDQPFFGFFDTVHLKPLSVDDATDLLEKLADLNGQPELKNFLRTPQGRARLRAIHHLAGGNPRLYIILSDFLTRESLDDLVRPFMETVDRQLTAYYQERLRWLSAQQQEIVQFLCHRASPVPVKEIAEGIFAAHNTTTSQLKQLREKGYVSFRPRGREVFYELAEPLMRLSFQVKETHNRQPLRLIVDFLRVWYDRKELEKRLANIEPGTPGREYFEAALQSLTSEGAFFRHELLRSGLNGVDLANCDNETLDHLHCLAEETDNPGDWNKYASALAGRNNYKAAFDVCSSVIARPDSLPDQRAQAYLCRAVLNSRASEPEEAVADCEAVASLQSVSLEFLARAWTYRGCVYTFQGNVEAALESFARVVNMTYIPVEQLAMAHYSRGAALCSVGRLQEASREFTTVILLPLVSVDYIAKSLHFRGLVHGLAGLQDKAISDFTEVINLAHAPAELVQSALLNRACTLVQLDRAADAILDFERVFTEADNIPVRKNPDFYPSIIIPAILESIFLLMGGTTNWKAKAMEFTAKLCDCGLGTPLGESLVHHLRRLAASHLNRSGLDEWAAGWTDAGAGREELEVPLRLLQAGATWIKTKDESSLLSLPKEERRIVREAVGLPAESS